MFSQINPNRQNQWRLFFTAVVLIFVSTLSCKKNEQKESASIVDANLYMGSNNSLQKLYDNLKELDNRVHFSDSIPKDGSIDWNKVLITGSIADTATTFLIPIKSLTGYLDIILSATRPHAGPLSMPVFLHAKGVLATCTSVVDSLKATAAFMAFQKEGYQIDDFLKSIYTKISAPVAATKPMVLKSDRTLRTGERCSLVFTASWFAQINSCDVDMFAAAVNQYIFSQLQQSFYQDYNTGFNITPMYGLGVVIEGPTDILANMSESELSYRISAILTQFMLGNNTGCNLISLYLYSLTILSNASCNPTEGGGNPDPINCSQRTEAQAQAEVEEALSTVEELNVIIPNAPSTDMALDEYGEYYLNEAPVWKFLRYKLPANYILEYALVFKSERYIDRSPKTWRSFIYEPDKTVPLSIYSGTIPPCADAECKIKTLTTNISADALKATATLNYKLTLKIACAFGWQVSSKENVDPMLQDFPAYQNY